MSLQGDTEGLFRDPWPDLELMAAVYKAAHAAEETFPGFIRDELDVETARMCARVDHGVWLAVNDAIEPSPLWLAARVAETGGKC